MDAKDQFIEQLIAENIAIKETNKLLLEQMKVAAGENRLPRTSSTSSPCRTFQKKSAKGSTMIPYYHDPTEILGTEDFLFVFSDLTDMSMNGALDVSL